MLNKLWNKIMRKRKEVQIVERINIRGRIFIHGKKKGIIIGNNVTLFSNENVNTTSGFNHIHLKSERVGALKIGNNVGISNSNIVAFNSVIIEDNVLIGSGVKIWDTDFHPVDYEKRINKVEPQTAPITIKEGAFIGACSIILKGVTVGSHSVVGAGSVVTHNVPDGEIWAGNPAKFIKRIS